MAHTRLTLLLAFTLACSGTVIAGGQAPESSSSPDATAREESPYGAQLQEILDQHEVEWRPCVEVSSQVMKNALETSTASAEGRQEDVARLQKEIVPLRQQLGECGRIKEGIVAEMRETGAPDDALNGAWRAFSPAEKPEPIRSS